MTLGRGFAIQGYPDVQDQDVLAYLKAENDYFEAAMAPHKALTDQLFEEMKGRIKEDDSSVPIKDGDWLYWWAFARHPISRLVPQACPAPARRAGMDADLQRECRSRGQGILSPRGLRISPDGKLLATLVDDDGSERFKLVIRDLATGKDLETVTKVGIGNPVWTSDSSGLVFTEVNDQWRILPRPISPHGKTGQGGHAVRGEGRHRFFGRRGSID